MLPDVSKATNPVRHRREGPSADTEGAQEFQRQYPIEARRYGWLQNQVLWPLRHADVNPIKMDLGTPEEMTEHIKNYVLEVGADSVGVAEMDPNFVFKDAEMPAAHPRHRLRRVYEIRHDVGHRRQLPT